MPPPSSPAAQTRPLVFQVPLWQRIFSAFGVVVCAVVSVLMAGFAVLCLIDGWFVVSAIIALCAGVLFALARYVWRDFRGKWGLRVELTTADLILTLPAGRSLIHRLSALSQTIPYADIATIETRLEAYRSVGMAMVQRAFALRRRSGELIFLFEDRALGTGMAMPFGEPIVAAIRERTRAPLRDLGMVEGKGGVLGAWGTESADWSAPGMDAAAQERIWRAARYTGTVALVLAVGILLWNLASYL